MPRVSHNILKDILSGMRTVYLSFPFVQTVCPGSCLLPILLGRNIGKNCLPAVTITAATASPIYPPRNRFSYHFLSWFPLFFFTQVVVAGIVFHTTFSRSFDFQIFQVGGWVGGWVGGRAGCINKNFSNLLPTNLHLWSRELLSKTQSFENLFCPQRWSSGKFSINLPFQNTRYHYSDLLC